MILGQQHQLQEARGDDEALVAVSGLKREIEKPMLCAPSLPDIREYTSSLRLETRKNVHYDIDFYMNVIIIKKIFKTQYSYGGLPWKNIYKKLWTLLRPRPACEI
jgi:hypothetical protein